MLPHSIYDASEIFNCDENFAKIIITLLSREYELINLKLFLWYI